MNPRTPNPGPPPVTPRPHWRHRLAKVDARRGEPDHRIRALYPEAAPLTRLDTASARLAAGVWPDMPAPLRAGA
jgi:hypothetical protein